MNDRWLFRAALLSIGLVSVTLLCESTQQARMPFHTSHAEGKVDDETSQDPIPFRRIVIPSDRIAGELDNVRQGTLLQLTRQEFETKLQKARAAMRATRNPPRLVETRYRAKLQQSFLAGSALFRIANRSKRAEILNLKPLNLAVTNARVLKPPLPPSDAIIADFEANRIGLLIDDEIEQSVLFDWTARGVATPGTLRFDLRLPAAAIASIELSLPNDFFADVNDPWLMSGPLPSETDEQKLWRIDGNAQTQLELLIHTATPNSHQPSSALAQLNSRQDIEPDGVRAEFEFQLQLPQGGTKSLLFELDPEFRVLDVVARSIADWRVVPAKTGPKKPQLHVELREPQFGGAVTLLIRGMAPFQLDKRWRSPSVTLKDSILRGETVVLRIHPQLVFEDWRSGGFAFAPHSAVENSAATLGARARTDAWQSISLIASAAFAGASNDRPSAIIRGLTATASVRQSSWLQVNADHAVLTSQLNYVVTQGHVNRIDLQLPDHWDVERVEAAPASSLTDWRLMSMNESKLLTADLQLPIGALTSPRAKGNSVALSITLRTQFTPRINSEYSTVPLPLVSPLAATCKENALAITIAKDLQAELTTSMPSSNAPSEGVWSDKAVDYSLISAGQLIEGSLRVRARPSFQTTHVHTDALITEDVCTIVTSVEVRPNAGAVNHVDLWLPGAINDPRNWQVEGSFHATPAMRRLWSHEPANLLGIVGLCDGFSVFTRLAAPPNSYDLWRLELAAPRTEPLVLKLKKVFRPVAQGPANDIAWQIPLVVVRDAHATENEVTLRAVGALFAQAAVVGAPQTSAPADTGLKSQRTFEYGPGFAALTMRTRRMHEYVDPGAGEGARAVNAKLHTTIQQQRLVHAFRFVLQDWTQRSLPIRFPPKVKCLASRIDNRWIAQLNLQTAEAGGTHLTLPVPVPTNHVHVVELIYSTDLPPWRLWTQATSPAPELPVALIDFHRSWSLPSPCEPFTSADLTGPEKTAEQALNSVMNNLIGSNQTAISTNGDRSHTLASGELSNRLRDALELLLRKSATPMPRTVSLTLLRLSQLLNDDYTFVIDLNALNELRISPFTALSFNSIAASAKNDLTADGLAILPLSDGAKLAIIPHKNALVVTALRPLDDAQSIATAIIDESPEFARALAEAIEFGQDQSGRLQSVAEWLRNSASLSFGVATGAPFEVGLTTAVTNVWQQKHPASTDQTITVVRRDVMIGITGLACLIGLGSAIWVFRRRKPVMIRWFFSAVLGCWIVALWFPPAAAVAIVAIFVTVIAFFILMYAHLFRQAWRNARGLTVAIVFSASGLLFVLSNIIAAEDAVHTVLYLSDGDAPQAKQLVLVPPALLDLLKDRAKHNVLESDRCVIYAASYDGSIANDQATLEAVFHVYNMTDSNTPLRLPLSNIRLRDVLCDGASATVTALRAPQEGFQIDIRGAGRHLIRVRFQVSATEIGAERELRFAIPDVAQCRCSLLLPKDSHSAYCVAARGAQQLRVNGDADHRVFLHTRLEADIGAVTALHVRWTHKSSSDVATIQAREAYSWTVSPNYSSLSAICEFTVTRSSTNRLRIRVPDQLLIRSVEATRRTNAIPDDPLPRISQWRVTKRNDDSVLDVWFQRPLSGGVQLDLEFILREPQRRLLDLPFPRPIADHYAEGFVAYQLHECKALPRMERGLVRDRTNSFQAFWLTVGKGDPSRGIAAYALQRSTISPALQLEMLPPETGVSAVWDVAWNLGQNQATVVSAVRIQSRQRNLCFVELIAPEQLTGLTVSGPDVRSWFRQGARLQIWLHKPVENTTIIINGGQPLPHLSEQPDRSVHHFKLEAWRLPACDSQVVFVQVVAQADLQLQPVKLQNLFHMPDPRPQLGEWNFVSPLNGFEAVFLVRYLSPARDADMLTFLEAVDEQIALTYLVSIKRGSHSNSSVVVRSPSLGTAPVSWSAGGAVVREVQGAGAQRVWQVDISRFTGDTVDLRMTTRLSTFRKTSLEVPEFTLDGPMRQRKWVAIAGRELRATASHGLKSSPATFNEIKRWSAETERIRRAGVAWEVVDSGWLLRVRLSDAMAKTPSRRVLLVDQYSRTVAGQQWHHCANLLTFNRNNDEWEIVIPHGARLTSWMPQDARPEFGSDDVCQHLVVPGQVGMQTIGLQWRFQSDFEAFERPNLSPVAVVGVPTELNMWTMAPPPHARIQAVTPASSSRVALDLHRARAYFKTNAAIAELSAQGIVQLLTSQFVNSQAEFARTCDWIRLASQGADEVRKELNALRGQNDTIVGAFNANQNRLDNRPDGEAAAAVQVSVNGTSIDAFNHWNLNSWMNSAMRPGRHLFWWASELNSTPIIEFSNENENELRSALGASLTLGALLLATWCASYWPRSVQLLGATWPEHFIVFGVGLWLVGGAASVAPLAAGVGLFARGLLIWPTIRAHVFKRTASV